MPPAVEVQSPNHWTTSEFPKSFWLNVRSGKRKSWVRGTGREEEPRGLTPGGHVTPISAAEAKAHPEPSGTLLPLTVPHPQGAPGPKGVNQDSLHLCTHPASLLRTEGVWNTSRGPGSIERSPQCPHVLAFPPSPGITRVNPLHPSPDLRLCCQGSRTHNCVPNMKRKLDLENKALGVHHSHSQISNNTVKLLKR